jgi:SAM-dependent methyltransferase
VIFITHHDGFILQLACMEKQFWNTRYEENKTVYGTQPHDFLKQFIDTHQPGTILLPAEGEGRNALYAASKGWKVDAFDFSEVAMEKAIKKAEDQKLKINYQVFNLEKFKAVKTYDAVALIYVHLPERIRRTFHREVYQSLKSGGFLVFEAFAKEQLRLDSGGSKDPALLYDAPSICNDFQFLHVLYCAQKEVELNEGPFHKGKAAVLQLVGQKL